MLDVVQQFSSLFCVQVHVVQLVLAVDHLHHHLRVCFFSCVINAGQCVITTVAHALAQTV
jgi:hypothetical protein